jgi:hypothetical protein
MSKFKLICSSFASHFKLNYKQYLLSDEEKKMMNKVPYAFIIGNSMYVMI